MTEQIRGDRRRWYVLLFLCLSLFIIAVDNTVLSLALPSISEDLGSTAGQLQWIVDSYILVFAALLLTMGSLGDRFGRKRLLQAGLVLFGAGSLAAALSTSNGMLIGCRAFIGIGAAMIMPSTLSIITDVFRNPKERTLAIALWSAVFALGAGIGPVIGGYLLDSFDWSSVFYINIPVVAVALVGGYLFIRESTGEGAPKPDVPGVILSAAGLFALIYGVIEAGAQGWGDSSVLLYLAMGLVILGIFVWWENRSETPMLPLGFFKNMSFSAATLSMVAITFVMTGVVFFTSQYFQSVQGYSPVAAAIRMLPAAATVVVFNIVSARVVRYLGTKLTVSLGVLISSIGLFYLAGSLEVDSSYLVWLTGMIILCFGLGLAMTPATDSIMSALPVNRAGIGSAMNDTTRQMGAALGVAVMGAIMNATYLDKMGKLDAIASLPENVTDAIESSIQSAHIVAAELPPDVSQVVITASSEAFTSGMNEAVFVGAIMMVVACLITFLVLPHRIQRADEGVGSEPVMGLE